MSNNRNSGLNFGLGLLMGAAIGAVATIFATPRSGEDNRKLLKDFGDDAKKKIETLELDKKVKGLVSGTDPMYLKVQSEVQKRIDELQEAKEKIDDKKYMALVDDALKNLKKNSTDASEKFDELRSKFKEDSKDLVAQMRHAHEEMHKHN